MRCAPSSRLIQRSFRNHVFTARAMAGTLSKNSQRDESHSCSYDCSAQADLPIVRGERTLLDRMDQHLQTI